MSKLDEVQRVLNSRFRLEDKELREKDFKISIEKKSCNYILYKYDDPNILRGLSGGLFPFFNDSEGVKKMPDYIMFAENGPKFYALIFELKEKREFPIAQINAGKAFIKFIIETINRTGGIAVYPEIRGLGFSRFKSKPTTKIKDVIYKQDYCEYKYNRVNIDLLLN